MTKSDIYIQKILDIVFCVCVHACVNLMTCQQKIEMGGTCGTYGGRDSGAQGFGGET